MKKIIIYIVSVITSLSLGVIGTLVVVHYIPAGKTEIIERTVKDVTITETNTIKESIDKVYDATVLVETYANGKVVSTGTGFVYKKDNQYGYILTNHHVIADGKTYKIIDNSGQEIEAKLLGSDEYSDLAVLSIDQKKVLQVAKIGDSTKANLGDTLFTVGSPLGRSYIGTVTKGTLSGKNRTVSVQVRSTQFMMEVLQTDAAINPGNSGGPLVNINGEVIGINSLKLVEDKIEGMGFAIPIEMAMSCVDRLEQGKVIDRPLFGAELSDVEYVYQLGLLGIEIDKSITHGSAIVNVNEKMPAKNAGLQKGDIILEVDGVSVQNTAHFRFLLYKYEVGSKIKITYFRDKKKHEAEVLLNVSLDGN